MSTFLPDCIPKCLIVSKLQVVSSIDSENTPLSFIISQVRLVFMQAIAMRTGSEATCMQVLVMQPLTLSPTLVASMKTPYDRL